jgi:hypothetical protein
MATRARSVQKRQGDAIPHNSDEVRGEVVATNGPGLLRSLSREPPRHVGDGTDSVD